MPQWLSKCCSSFSWRRYSSTSPTVFIVDPSTSSTSKARGVWRVTWSSFMHKLRSLPLRSSHHFKWNSWVCPSSRSKACDCARTSRSNRHRRSDIYFGASARTLSRNTSLPASFVTLIRQAGPRCTWLAISRARSAKISIASRCMIPVMSRLKALSVIEAIALENERIRDFVKQGVSVLRAAVVLKRGTKSVRSQARKIGSPFPSVRDGRKSSRATPQAHSVSTTHSEAADTAEGPRIPDERPLPDVRGAAA